ncbi:MAG TPA: lysozyme inhibitor LprI family protein [Burkholderiales bacterium]|jgi:uncharacterized protein YecT (DUF1311 family)|nr:lysozyme inhibitor LprI family protein [Burkholderiales bacterium]
MTVFITLLALLMAGTAFAADTTCTQATTQADLDRCMSAAAAAKQKRLDALLAELKRSLMPEARNLLEQSQAAWDKSRKLDCEIEASFFAGGSIQPTIVSGCYVQHTSDRINRLRYYLCPDYAMTGDCEAAAKYK